MASMRLFLGSTVGKKVIMALSGVVLLGFVFVHMAANLQVFAGPETMNAYAKALRQTPALLWGTRLVLLAAGFAHVATALQLQAVKRKARGQVHGRQYNTGLASRTMIYTGLWLLLFVVLHLANLTWGNIHPAFEEGQVFQNVVILFRQAPWAALYAVAMVALGMHVTHGGWSMFQSVGLANASNSAGLRKFARVLSIIVAGGFLAIVAGAALGIIG